MRIFLFVFGVLASTPAFALDVFSLNVFDQLQGKWDEGFRARRMAAVASFVKARDPAIVVFQEARASSAAAMDSEDAVGAYPHRKYVHEMTGADGASYGYWIGAKEKPRKWIEDGFSFPGGVERKLIGAVWDNAYQGGCFGVIGLHLSYQTSEVRQKEAEWILAWLGKHESDCKSWLVLGDFNASEKDAEMRKLFAGGLRHLFQELKPTVGAFNPVRRIYGDNIPSLTIDWALGWNISKSAGARAEVVLDAPYAGEWVSDHAGVWVKLP